MIVTRNNRDALADTPTSDWFPNLESKLDALGQENKAQVLLAFRRLREDTQRNDERLAALEKQWGAATSTAAPAAGGVLTTFTELNVGSPASPAGSVRIRVGLGSPETVVQGSAWRDAWLRSDGKSGEWFYLKESGADDKIGWVAKF